MTPWETENEPEEPVVYRRRVSDVEPAGDWARWFLGVCVSIILIGGGFWLTNVWGSVADLGRAQSKLGERQASAEAHSVSLDMAVADLKATLKEIDAKVDQILERK